MSRYFVPTATGAIHPLQNDKNGDTKNCVVRTYANCMDICYQTAHEIFENLGRKNNQGMQFEMFVRQFLNNGFEAELFYHSVESTYYRKTCAALGVKITNSSMTLSRLLKDTKYSIGTYAVLVKGHIFTLRNGKIYDTPNSMMGKQTQVVCVFAKI